MSDDDDLDDVDMDSSDNQVDDSDIKTSTTTDLEARRRLEARLEERRLSRLIQDYDFDIQDIA
jgi:hypothetical protein